MKTVYIIHGCPPEEEKAMNAETRTYDKHWIPWLKRELISKGFNVETPMMPNPWTPSYENFKKEFEKYTITDNDIFVGHSCGCAFLVHWLGDTKQKIDKLILVAPWKIADGSEPFRKAFYGYSIDETIKDRTKEISMFTSNNEEEDGKKSLEIFHKALGGKITDLPNRGHYTFDDMGTEKFPELLENVIK
jgi:predicted alpha/beta hydrolase family esterase